MTPVKLNKESKNKLTRKIKIFQRKIEKIRITLLKEKVDLENNALIVASNMFDADW